MSVSEANTGFWDELCGTQLARQLGVNDATPASLKRFDDWYFQFYPYLADHIPFDRIKGRKVLEIGLGYGSVAQRLAEAGASYTGLDIAGGPAAMVNHRLSQSGLPGEAIQGDILNAPFPDDSFDFVVTIGCLHHTGDLVGAIEQVRRILKPGGEAILMVYNAYSYRRLIRWPGVCLRQLYRERFQPDGKATASDSERAAYDADSEGRAAPSTEFVSRLAFHRMTAKWTSREIRLENIGAESVLRHFRRETLLRLLGPAFGLDMYAVLRK